MSGSEEPRAQPAQVRTRAFSAAGRDLRLFIIAGEHSGDALGAELMAAMNERRRGRIRYLGVGGQAMAARGLVSQFAIEDVAVMGPGAILRRLPLIMRRIRSTSAAVVAADPDALVIIDSPEFTHRIASSVRRRRPGIPIIDYVAPSVWAWRPVRARKMRGYIDHVLALLPFEPEAYRRLSGPPCSYVGHPLIERLAWLRALDGEPLARRLALSPDAAVLVVLPGSRASEVGRLMGPFGAAIGELLAQDRSIEIITPVVEAVRGLIEEGLKAWPKRPHLISGEADKFRAFKLARAALAASGTVTLELAVSGIPTVAASRVAAWEAAIIRRIIRVPSIILANLVIGENIVPEFLQENCVPARLAEALISLLDGPARRRQLDAFQKLDAVMGSGTMRPSDEAAAAVLALVEQNNRPPTWS